MKRIFALLLGLLWLNTLLCAQELNYQRGKLRILQLTDLHYTGDERSAHVLPFLQQTARATSPDVIIISGDLIYNYQAERLFREVLAALEELKIPYAITLGNHDAEYELRRSEIYALCSRYEHCLNGRIEGGEQGRFVIPVRGGKGVDAALYLMDSHTYDYARKAYEGVNDADVAWYLATSRALEEQAGRKPNALMFMHMPLKEHRQAYDADETRVGFRLENECPGEDSAQMFPALLERGEVRGLFVGHDHSNNYLATHRGIVLGYGRYSGSYGVYQELVSGVRLFELCEGKSGFTTWERLINGDDNQRKCTIE